MARISGRARTYGSEGSLQEVTHGGSRTLGLGVHILYTSHLKQTLGSRGSDDTGTTGSGDETAHDGADLSRDLGGDGVGFTKSGTPVTSSDGDDGELGEDDSTTDGGRDFLGALDTQTDVAVEVTDGDESLETGALTGTSLLLDGHDLHDFILELGQEVVDDLELLDGEREEVDLFHGLDLSILYETAELGDGDPGRDRELDEPVESNGYSPFLVLVLATATPGATATPAPIATTTAEASSSSC